MMVRELQTPDGLVLPYRDVTPSSLAADPLLELYISPWLNREVSVLLEPDTSLAAYVRDLIIDLVKKYVIDSEVNVSLSHEWYLFSLGIDA